MKPRTDVQQTAEKDGSEMHRRELQLQLTNVRSKQGGSANEYMGEKTVRT